MTTTVVSLSFLHALKYPAMAVKYRTTALDTLGPDYPLLQRSEKK